MKSNNSILKRIGLTNSIIVLMQLCMYPYLFFVFWELPGIKVMSVVFFVVIVLLCLLKIKKKGSVPFAIVVMMVIQSFVWVLYYCYYNDTSYLVRLFFIILAYFSLLLLNKDDGVIKFSKIYNYIIAIQGVLGVIAFFLIFFRILEPIASKAFNDIGEVWEFYGLTFSKVHIGNFIRVNGFFDEPGAFAFWGMFSLLFNKLLFDNKKIEFVIIISLLFTFSAAYFVLLPIYLCCFYSNRVKTFLVLLALLFPVVFITAKLFDKNEAFVKYTLERFEGGSIETTRYDQAELTKKAFDTSPIIGIGANNLEEKFGSESSDNPYEILAKDGIIGLLVTYLPLLYIAFKYRRKEILVTVLILSLSYGQRPFHINEMHFFMIYLLCNLIILKYKNTQMCLQPSSRHNIVLNER